MNYPSPPAAARSLDATRAWRAQMRCQGNPTHDALSGYLPLVKVFHVNISMISHILNLKFALDHAFMEKYPQLTIALLEELFVTPRRSWACHEPQIYTLGHLPFTVLGWCQISSEHPGDVPQAPCPHLQKGPCFSSPENSHTHTKQKRHVLDFTLQYTLPHDLIKIQGLL